MFVTPAIDRRFYRHLLLTGSRDETVRVWNATRGHLLTLFDVHAAVCDVTMTSDAGRILVRLADGCHVPFLCLHNSPAAAATTARSQTQLEPAQPVAGQSLATRDGHHTVRFYSTVIN